MINYDFPIEADQYLHRVGRAGRFGTKGLAISFISDEEEQKVLDEVQRRFEVKISELPETIDVSSYSELRARARVCVCVCVCVCRARGGADES